MPAEVTGRDEGPSVDDLFVIVVGAHLRAEVSDRPLAYRLREQVLRWIDERKEAGEGADDFAALEPIVCSDLWYLNNEELLERPTVSIGSPGVNAVTAFFASRVPMAFALDDTLQVQLDPAYRTHWSCLWGVNPAATASAVDLFAERYLDRFLAAAHGIEA